MSTGAVYPSPETPWRVTTAEGEVKVIITDKRRNDVPVYAAALAGRAAAPVALRIAGGCSNMSKADKVGMLAFFEEALAGFEGIITSGSTRAADKSTGEWDPMVTDIPAVIAARNPRCVTLGTAPRTSEYFRLVEDSRFVLDESGTGPNPGMHVILLVQDGHSDKLDWDGDLDLTFDLMDVWRQAAGFRIGWIGWNGGGVTERELLRAAGKGWPVFLAGGSGRKTDELIAKLTAKDPELLDRFPNGHPFVIGSKDTPSQFRESLRDRLFIP